MDCERVFKAYLRTIVSDAEQKLGRNLRDHERRFSERRGRSSVWNSSTMSPRIDS